MDESGAAAENKAPRSTGSAGRGLPPAVWIPLLIALVLGMTWLFYVHPPFGR